jgi:peroxiredoxin
MSKIARRMFIVLSVAAFWATLLVSVVLANAAPPQPNSPLPDFKLPIPEHAADKEYLGLTSTGSFTITQIKAQVVIIEILSMYCPYCQREAPEVNRLYDMIETTPSLKGAIKLIGIGAGNTPFEVQVFKGKYSVPFPVFSDEDFTLHKAFGEVRTPFFIGVRINDDGTHRVFYAKLGGIEGAESFVKLILRLSGLEQEKKP